MRKILGSSIICLSLHVFKTKLGYINEVNSGWKPNILTHLIATFWGCINQTLSRWKPWPYKWGSINYSNSLRQPHMLIRSNQIKVRQNHRGSHIIRLLFSLRFNCNLKGAASDNSLSLHYFDNTSSQLSVMWQKRSHCKVLEPKIFCFKQHQQFSVNCAVTS